MRVAIGQTTRFPNFSQGIDWLLSEISNTADVLVLPEYWIGTTPLDREELNHYVTSLVKIAERISGVVIGGAVAIHVGEVKTICPIVEPGGGWTYGEKIFPSAATGERKLVSRGSKLAMFKTAGWSVGCLICVDLVYPELVRKLAREGAEVVVNPASVTSDRRELWKAIGLTRSFENSIYVISAVGTGYRYRDGRPVEGGSYVATPNGALEDFGKEPGVFYVELKRGELEFARARRRYLEDSPHAVEVAIEKYLTPS